MDNLIEKGLVKCELEKIRKNHKRYYLTDTGKEALSHYCKAINYLSDDTSGFRKMNNGFS